MAAGGGGGKQVDTDIVEVLSVVEVVPALPVAESDDVSYGPQAEHFFFRFVVQAYAVDEHQLAGTGDEDNHGALELARGCVCVQVSCVPTRARALVDARPRGEGRGSNEKQRVHKGRRPSTRRTS